MYKSLLLFFVCLTALGQKQKYVLTSKVGTLLSTDQTPFLLRSNQYGLVPVKPNLFYLNTSLNKPYDSTEKTINYGYGIEPHINLGANSQILLPEIYVKGKWKAIEVYVGRRREIQGYVDTLGTMGSFIWSGNALPVPKIDIGIREFTPITKNGILALKGNFAHGWLGNGDSVKNVLLHQKSLYFRLGKPAWKVRVIGGFNHQAQWGGKPAVPFKDEISGQYITTYGSNFKDFIRVFTGKSIGKDTGLGWDEVEGVAGNEAGNRIGNHLGSVDLGMEIDLASNATIKIYRQSFYEDGSLFYLNNISDGLTGISFSGKNHFRITFEYLKTAHQGGSIYYGNIPELRGGDNYFNNGIYKDGWTYRGSTIGTPLLNPYHENPDAFPTLKRINHNYIYNNRVQAVNIKAIYWIKDISMITQLVHSKNLGHYVLPINKNAVSIMQAVKFKFKEYIFSPRLAIDAGGYYPTSLGVDFSVTRNW